MEDLKIREKVLSLMEMTQRSEEDVCCALYECDNDLDRAVIFLLEQLPINAFATTSKKRKNKNKEDNTVVEEEWNESQNLYETKDKNRNRGSGQPLIRNGLARLRDKRREERNNNSDFKVDLFRPGPDHDRFRNSKPSGVRSEKSNRNILNSSRGHFRGSKSRNHEHHEIDAWDASQGLRNDQNKQNEITIDTWGDWDNEEYTGSLNDTKVFTPSASSVQPVEGQTEISVGGLNLDQPSISSTSPQNETYNMVIVSSSGNSSSSNQSQYPERHSGSSAAQQLRQALELPQLQTSSLSAEQTQYVSTVSPQNLNSNSSYQAAVQFPVAFTNTNQYNSDQMISSQQASQIRRHRARVPPPSKIPSSAVEMPGDSLNSIGYLDVQFGGLDLGNDDAFESIIEKYGSVMESSQTVSSTEISEFQSKSNNLQTSLSSTGLQASQMLSNSETVSQNDGLSCRTSNSGSLSGANTSNFTLNKPDPYLQSTSSFSTNPKISSYQQNSYTSSFSSTQVSYFENLLT